MRAPAATRLLAALLLPAGLALATALALTAATARSAPAVQAQAAAFRLGAIVVRDPWARPTPPGAGVGVVYLSIANGGHAGDELQSAASPRAHGVEIHESRTVNGMMQMRPVRVLALPAGATVRSAPGGLHIMLVGLDAPLAAGTEFPLALHFRDAGTLSISVRVEARGDE